MEIYNSEADIKNFAPAAVALGYFDGVHIGHAHVIRAAREFGLKTVVLTFKKLEKNGKFSSLTGDELKEEAFKLFGVDALVYLDFETVRHLSPEQFITECISKKLNAKAVVCGFNYKFGCNGAAGPKELTQLCSKYCIAVRTVEPVTYEGQTVSSTHIKHLVENGLIREATSLLGRPFAFYYEVVRGRQLGRLLGSPTINQILPEWQVKPKFGVYASVTSIDNMRYSSVTNVGVRPTVGSDCILAETFIRSFCGDLYGRRIKVELIDFLRNEQKFSDIDQLKEQIIKDSERAKAYVRDL